MRKFNQKAGLEKAKTFVHDRSGTVAILSAHFFILTLMLGALAIDMASLYTERRQAQGAVDLAAMAAAADLNEPEAAARATLAANGLANIGTVTVETGNYMPDPTIAAGQRFRPTVGPINAARVTLVKPGRSYLARAFTRQTFTMKVTGVAANGAVAAFSVGSRLAAVQGGLVNALLGGLFGSQVSLSAMDYNSLLSTDIKLLPYLTALGTRLQLTGPTYNDVLQSQASLGTAIRAAADVTQQDGNSRASAALLQLAAAADRTSLAVPLTSLIDMGPLGNLQTGDPAAGLDAKANVMQMVSGAAVLANGKNQVAVDLAANIPGISKLTLTIAIGEPPQQSAMTTVGGAGSYARTAQTRFLLVADVGGTGLLSGTTLHLPLYIELANAEAQLASVSCVGSGQANVTVAARPGIADVWIGEPGMGFSNTTVSPSVSPATIVNLPLVKVTGSAHVSVSNINWNSLSFNQSDIDNGVIKQTDTRNYTQSLVTSALGNLSLNVQAGPLSLSIPTGITAAVGNTLGGVAAPLDDVVYSLLTALGVHLGQADIRVLGARCTGYGQLAG